MKEEPKLLGPGADRAGTAARRAAGERILVGLAARAVRPEPDRAQVDRPAAASRSARVRRVAAVGAIDTPRNGAAARPGGAAPGAFHWRRRAPARAPRSGQQPREVPSVSQPRSMPQGPTVNQPRPVPQSPSGAQPGRCCPTPRPVQPPSVTQPRTMPQPPAGEPARRDAPRPVGARSRRRRRRRQPQRTAAPAARAHQSPPVQRGPSAAPQALRGGGAPSRQAPARPQAGSAPAAPRRLRRRRVRFPASLPIAWRQILR